MGKKRKKQDKKLTVSEAKEWLLNKTIEQPTFYSSVRDLSRIWGWGRTKVSSFLCELESDGVLERTLGGGGKTRFKMVEPGIFPVQFETASAGMIGIDIEQVYLGNITLTSESLDDLTRIYTEVMDGGETDLSVSQIDMIERILERQTPQRPHPEKRCIQDHKTSLFPKYSLHDIQRGMSRLAGAMVSRVGQ